MAELDTFQHLPKDAEDIFYGQSFRILFQFIQHCVVDELEDQVETFLASEDLYQVHQVLVTQLLQKRNQNTVTMRTMLFASLSLFEECLFRDDHTLKI
jgi:hypothetical protein